MKDVIVRVADWYQEFSAIQAIRKSVFQEEQGLDPDLDFDGQDETSQQLIASLNGEYVGTARVRYLDDKTAKIERLAVLPVGRGYGIGKKIMEKAMEVIASKNIPEVVIHAQEYIKGLHQQLGFQEEGEVFEEAGIRHVTMRKKLNQ
ncbi:GNAT family N-acetyltransferase [Brasilonema octagenarum UFV-E1]|uniref:GNAT family N-acetyltransferase n=1 Tax=Brasilonema sennae CENA114 TaxID=415709 RepID=A0A856MGD6_9CYAN|nr:GNAT family N-acetyltransferase [Brasilonema sennae]QDL09229.1 GNAT family N-acetyltransferase [Brasilonema sennae CENA114]QDL15588.1 GNAT family N-acetyltransferase [Brasilonema octagenarum UFV-E1]